MTDVKLTPAVLLAGLIRYRDGDNRMGARDLGATISAWLVETVDFDRPSELVAFVERTNPDKQMGAGQLAELIVAEFDLGKVPDTEFDGLPDGSR